MCLYIYIYKFVFFSQEPAPIKIVEKVEETEKVKEANDSSSSDTTNQHKNHLFDLNCKICTGSIHELV